jgi:hypothetical protein
MKGASTIDLAQKGLEEIVICLVVSSNVVRKYVPDIGFAERGGGGGCGGKKHEAPQLGVSTDIRARARRSAVAYGCMYEQRKEGRNQTARVIRV